MAAPKKRLDQYLVDLGWENSRNKAQARIMAGEILVNGEVQTKAGYTVKDTDRVEKKNAGPKFVSRGGQKLWGVLESLKFEVKDLVCLDVGASTGGFTDCLLQRGAANVYCMDVGKGQLDPTIRNHPKVVWKESFHVKNLNEKTFETKMDLITVDVSFISLTKVIPYLLPCLQDGGKLLVMVKPQFESERSKLKKGVVTDEDDRKRIIQSVRREIETKLHLRCLAEIDAPIKGPKGNQETFLLLETQT